MRQPKWTIDEVILGVDTYFEIGSVKNIKKDNPLVIELSKVLKELPIHNNSNSTFRNLTGVQMTLLSIAKLDEEAEYHLRASTKLQKKIFFYYKNQKDELKKVSRAIKNCLPLPFNYYEPIELNYFIGGNILYLFHLFIENKTKTAKIVKRDNISRKKSTCSVCGLDLVAAFGEKGFELLEPHYCEEIINYYSEMDVLPSKFKSLCPTCHKLSHSDPNFIKI